MKDQFGQELKVGDRVIRLKPLKHDVVVYPAIITEIAPEGYLVLLQEEDYMREKVIRKSGRVILPQRLIKVENLQNMIDAIQFEE